MLRLKEVWVKRGILLTPCVRAGTNIFGKPGECTSSSKPWIVGTAPNFSDCRLPSWVLVKRAKLSEAFDVIHRLQIFGYLLCPLIRVSRDRPTPRRRLAGIIPWA